MEDIIVIEEYNVDNGSAPTITPFSGYLCGIDCSNGGVCGVYCGSATGTGCGLGCNQ